MIDELLADVRERAGDPSIDEVPDRKLLVYLRSAARWLAGELELRVHTDSQWLQPTASVYEYPLPADVTELLWVRYGGKYLNPVMVSSWTRDGIDYTAATAGTPIDYAVEGRTLLLYPPPSSTIISSYPWLVASFLRVDGDANATESWLPAGGQDLLTMKAAQEYLESSAWGETGPLAMAKAARLGNEIGLRLPNVRRAGLRAARGAEERPTVFSRFGNYGR